MPFELIVPHPAPEQPGPLTLHVTTVLGFELGAGVSVAEYCADAPACTELGPETVKVKLLVIVTTTALDFAVSAKLLAVSVTFAGVGRICGAVYRPLGSTEPHADAAQPAPATLHVTLRSGLPALATGAANCRVAPSSTLTGPGEMVIAMSLLTITVAEALFELSAWLTAWITIVPGAGMICGAV